MNFKKILSLVLVGSLTLSLLSACGAPSTPPATDSTGATAGQPSSPDAVQELNLTTLIDVKTLDVNDARNANEMQVLSHIQEGLFRVFTDENNNDVVELAGAESFTVSPDGLVYTFILRDHLWSDGVPVTAQNYVDSFIRLLEPTNAFAYSFMAYDIKNATKFYNNKAKAEDVGVRAIDDKTFEITLEAAIPYFQNKLSNICFFPVRKDVIEAAGESYLNDYTKHVFNGPFVIESRILENEMVLAKNEKYWDAANVKLEKVLFTVVTEQATASLLIDNKELDVIEATSEYYDRWKKLADEGTLVNTSKTAASVSYLCYNQHKAANGGLSGLMNNAKVRLALSLAMDREEFNELIYNGINVPAYGLIPNGIMVGDKELRVINPAPLKAMYDDYTKNPDKLKALFVEGVKEVFPDKDPATVELVIFTSNSTSQTKSSLEYLKQTWEAKLGCKIAISIFSDTSLFVDARNKHQYDLVLMGWNGDYNDPMTFFELFNTTSGYAKFMGGYSNEKYDELFNSLATETDNEARAKIYVEMENNLVAEQSGTAPLYYTSRQYFNQTYVKNLSYPTFGSSFEFSRAYISGK